MPPSKHQNYRLLAFFLFTWIYLSVNEGIAQSSADSIKLKNGKESFPVVPFNYSLKFKDTDQSINLWKHGVKDAMSLVSSPLRWKWDNWAILGGIAAGGVVIYVMDEPLYESAAFIQGNSSGNFSKYFLDPLGDYRYQAVALAGLYGASWIFKDEKLKNASILTAEALLFTGATTVFVNFMTGRKMPNETSPLDHTQWLGINESSSFWSGHAAASFTVATVLSGVYNQKLWVPIASYSLATFVSLSRVVEGYHWTSDVFVGAAVGTIIGRMVLLNYRKKAVKFTPYYTGTFKGISARYIF